MISQFDARSRRRWPEKRLRRLFREAFRAGALESLSVTRSDAERVASNNGSALVGYELTYTSHAAGPSVGLRGDLRLSLQRGSWRVAWNKGLMWPGVQGAAGLDVLLRWPRRAPILDRRGRRLAHGDAASRRYPYGTLGGTIVGHLGTASKGQVREGPYERGDLAGASGLEGAYEARLAGAPSARLVVASRRGEPLKVLGREAGERARPIRSTIDIGVQRAVAEAYGSTVGGVVVLDPRRGHTLAAVSSSGLDPRSARGASGLTPFDRALSGRYPPGSAMKVVTASAALESRVVTPATAVTGPKEYKGVRNFESGQFGSIDFATAVRFSVNTAFAQVAERVGGRRLTRFAERFGFNRAPAMELPAATSSFPPPADLYDLMWGSIGQAQVLATPLEMASVAATIANGGRRMEPRATFMDPKRRERVVAGKTAATMGRLMQDVVNGGTGEGAQVPGVAVAGKTGTAEVDVDGRRRNHAWFICFAPAGAPKVAVAVVAELGGVGGEVAAPLAGAILQRVLPLVP
jgi:cell division protein FtsI/penicillin-binding protein 2